MDKEKMFQECMKMMSEQGHMGHIAGMATYGGYLLGKGLVGRLLGPITIFTIGAGAGILAYKYRDRISEKIEPVAQKIVEKAVKITDMGKDFVQEQKERLSDIVADIKEKEEDSAKE
ncbi:MAG: hypothetical protein HQL06_09465 [Nitrospirae bacterium]|nr:hypothetical protein [Nitrospirota bacterium]